MSNLRQAEAEKPTIERKAGGQDEEEEEMEGEEEVEMEKEKLEMERIHLVMLYPEEEEKKAVKSVEEMLRMAPARSSLRRAAAVAKGVQWGTSCTRLFEWCQGYETVPSDKRSPSLAMRYNHHLMVTESLADNEDFARSCVGDDGRREVKRLDYFGRDDREGLLEFVGVEVEEDGEMEMLAASRSRGCRCGGRCHRAICECRKAGVECWDWCQCGMPTYCDHCAADPTAGCSQHHSLDCGNGREERIEWRRGQRVAHDRERLARLAEMERSEGRVFFKPEELKKFDPMPAPDGPIKMYEAEDSDEFEGEEEEEVEGEGNGNGEEEEERMEENGEELDNGEEGEAGPDLEETMGAEEPNDEEDDVENEREEEEEVEEEEEEEERVVEGVAVEDEDGQFRVRMVVYPVYQVFDEEGELLGHMQFNEDDVEEEVVGEVMEEEELERPEERAAELEGEGEGEGEEEGEGEGEGEEEREGSVEDEQMVERRDFVPQYAQWEELVSEQFARMRISGDEGEGEGEEEELETTRSTIDSGHRFDPVDLDEIMEVEDGNGDEGRDGDEDEDGEGSEGDADAAPAVVVLRRSTRIRRPVDRFCIPVHVPKRRGKRAGGIRKKRRTRRKARKIEVVFPPKVPQPPRLVPFKSRGLQPAPVGPSPVSVDTASKAMTLAEAGAELKACREFFNESDYGSSGLDALLKLKRIETTWKRLSSPNVDVTPPMERTFIKNVIALRAMLGKAD